MISKNEHPMTSLCRDGVEIGLITANSTETVFFLYEPVGDDYRKLGRAESPLELEKRYHMYEKWGLNYERL